MPPWGPVNRRELIRALRQLGFDGPHAGKRHQFMIKGTLRLRIPNPHSGDISREMLAIILREGGIARDEWERL